MRVTKWESGTQCRLFYSPNRSRCSDDHPHSGRSSWYQLSHRCQSLGSCFIMVPIVGTWFYAKIMSFLESTNLHAKSTAQHWWEFTQRQKRLIRTIMSLPKSWPLNRDGSCRRHLIRCKNHGFRWVINSTSEPNRPHCSYDYRHSGKSSLYLPWNRCRNPGCRFAMAPTAETCFKQSSDKKKRRSENFRFSRASAEISAVDMKYKMESTAWKAADALRRLAQTQVGVSGSMTTTENLTIMWRQKEKNLTSSGEHSVSWEGAFPRSVRCRQQNFFCA